MITAYAGTAYHGAGPAARVPYRRSRYDRATGKFVSRSLPDGMKAVDRAHSALRAPGERADAGLKNWRVLRKIRSSPADATALVDAVQTLIINGDRSPTAASWKGLRDPVLPPIAPDPIVQQTIEELGEQG